VPAIICRCVSGLRPIWLTTALRSDFAVTSFPMPRPGAAVSLAMTVSFALALADDLVDHPLRRAGRP